MNQPAQLLVELSKAAEHDLDAALPIRWVSVHGGDGRRLLMRRNVGPYLYRGQTRRYRPCSPSICRGMSAVKANLSELSTRDRLLLAYRLALSGWFETALDLHPAVRWAVTENLSLNRVALAQHYGVPTGYIDLTESFDVAAFFATCTYNPLSRAWEPAATGAGVLYRVNWRRLPANRVKAIGLQPLPRPREQWAWTLELFLGDDFEDTPYLETITFAHDQRIGAHFLAQFRGGALLFPPDPLAQVADRLVASRTVPRGLATAVIEDLARDDPSFGPSATTLASIERDLGIAFPLDTSNAITVSEQAELSDIWTLNAPSFLEGVGLTLVRTLRAPPPNTR